jgi:hypothetical protein
VLATRAANHRQARNQAPVARVAPAHAAAAAAAARRMTAHVKLCYHCTRSLAKSLRKDLQVFRTKVQ